MAEPSASDSTTPAKAQESDSGHTADTAKRSRVRVAKPAATAGGVATTATDGGVATRVGSTDTTPRNSNRGRTASRGEPAERSVDSQPVTAAGQRAVTESIPTAAVTGTQKPGPIEVAGRDEEPASSADAAAVAVATPAVAAPVVAVPTPAAPAPAPVPALPPLPVPALPVPPASAVTVNGSTGTTRRTAMATATVEVVDSPTHVLLIGVDGANLSKILADPANVGFFDLMDESVTGASSIVGHTTLSGPSWSTILTGAWDNKTGVINNIFSARPYDNWPTVFNLLEAHDSSIETTVIAEWDYITGIAGAGAYPVDNPYYIAPLPGDTDLTETDALVTDLTVDLIKATDPGTSSFMMTYTYGVDEAGHLYGGDSPEYAAALRYSSANVDRIMDAVREWEIDTGEDWSVIVVTDHGHQAQLGFGHGFQSPAETSTFVIADFAGDEANDGKQNLAYSTVNVTPTILDLFGAPLRSDFDGVPMQDDPAILDSIVTPNDLKQSLSAAIAAYGFPDIATEVVLGIRTIFGAIPYFLDGFVTDISTQLQAIVDQDIFLVSALAGVTEFAVQVVGDTLVTVTNAVAHAVGYLTGAGTIAPSDPPLQPPVADTAAQAVGLAALSTNLVTSPNLLINPGAEVGDPSLSGFSAVTIPGWSVTEGTPTVIEYGTPRNLWPIGTGFKMPDLPSFLSFPKAKTGPADGGAQFFGGGDVATGVLTQTVDLSAAAAAIDLGAVSYNLSGWMGGFLFDPSSASIKVTFLDENKLYLGSDQIGPVGALDRWLQTGFKERETTGYLPEGTRSAQVVLTLDDRNPRLIGFRADYNNAYADNLSFTISSNAVSPAVLEPPVSTVGELDHVFMVYMENKGYDDIVGSALAPFLNSLINAYGLASDYHGLTHPSLPNYYPIIGGTDFGLTYNCGTPCIDAQTTLVSNIEDAGKTWSGYAQSMPAPGTLEPVGDYSPEELPFFAFSSIANDPDRAANVKPLEQLALDLQSPDTAPNFAWFAANEDFNGEGPVDFPWGALKFALSQLEVGNPYNIPALDQFLSETVPVILNSAVWQDPALRSALFVTFDEDNNNTSLGFGNEDNHVVMVVVPSPGAVAAGMRSGPFIVTDYYNHYSLLRTIEEALGIDARLTNNDTYAQPMNGFWDGTGATGTGTVV